MARRTVNYTVTSEGRDKGKLFVITEMPAAQGEAWATRALLAIMAGNGDVPEDFTELGAAGLAALGIKMFSSLKWDALKPLLDEMFECIDIIPDKKKMQTKRELIESDIEEIETRFRLRAEWWDLHLGFLMAGLPSLGDAAKKIGKKTTLTAASAESSEP